LFSQAWVPQDMENCFRGFSVKKRLGNAAVEEKEMAVYSVTENYINTIYVKMQSGTCSYHWALNCYVIFLLLNGVGKEVPFHLCLKY
jgi:hypothetical protein